MPEEARASLPSVLAADRTGCSSVGQRWRFHGAGLTVESCAPARPWPLWSTTNRGWPTCATPGCGWAVQIGFWSPTEGGMHTREVPDAYSVWSCSMLRSTGVRVVMTCPRSGTSSSWRSPRSRFPWTRSTCGSMTLIGAAARRQQALHALGLDAGHDSIADARFRQHDQRICCGLLASSLWIRDIQLVSDGERRPWVKTDSPRTGGRRSRAVRRPGPLADGELARALGDAARPSGPCRSLPVFQRRLLPGPANWGRNAGSTEPFPGLLEHGDELLYPLNLPFWPVYDVDLLEEAHAGSGAGTWNTATR